MSRFRFRHTWIALLVAAGGTIGFATPMARGQEIRLSQNIPGDSKPIVLYADEVTTWLDGSRRIILLKGTVLVEQGVVHARMQQAVAWMDQDRARRSGITHLDLFAEGNVRLENGAEMRNGPKAIVDLNTRGELILKAQKSKVAQAPRPDDPLYGRALPEIARVATPVSPASAGTILRTSHYGPVDSAAPVTPVLAPAAGPPAAAPLQTVQVPPPTGGGFSAPTLAAPAPPPGPAPIAVPGSPGAAIVPPRRFTLAPRTSGTFNQQQITLPGGEQATFITGGLILTVFDLAGIGLLDIEADRAIIWTRGNFQELFGNLRRPEGTSSREVEVYLAGNVEIREQNGPESRTLRASEVYYDLERSVAVARAADLEFKQPRIPDPIHFRAEELLQLSKTEFKGFRGEVFASRLPSDPGLKLYVSEGTLEEKRIPKRTIFGRQYVDRQTGQPETETQRLFRGDNLFVELENVPVFYFPFLQGDANDPLGPLQEANIKYDRIFGAQFLTTFNVYDLIGIDPIPGTRWRLDVDYLSRRGPALGTTYDYGGKNLFDLPGAYNGIAKAYGIYDRGNDILGGPRTDLTHPDLRGRFLERHYQELPDGFTLQLQVSALSDKNFLEQYFKDEFDRDINQETFVYVKQQQDNWAWTALVEPRIRNFVTETQWLPRVDGVLIGENFSGVPFLDRLTYNAHASLAYADLSIPHVPPPPVTITDQSITTGRFDLMQELSLPFTAGPFRLVPYAVLDTAYYTRDLAGGDEGRLYGGGGLRASIPFTRLYPDVQSEYLNLNGINHKIVVSANFYAAHTDTSFSELPQLDRLNDDATDQALRDIKPLEPFININHGLALANSPLYDPQMYAIRRLLDDRVDTLDSIEVLEVDVRQRLQTKRGYPGMQHIVDWMTLDLSGSYFPEAQQNFGDHFAFLQYDYIWNVGDRTALVSTGWVDPIENGARVFTVGAFLNRPDRTSFFLGYREIDPLQSQAVTAAATYIFSPKYAMTASTTYDFGISQSLSNSLVFTRMGSDLQVSLGINYNAILNNFGVVFEILPNLTPETRRVAGVPAFGSSALGR